MEIGIIILILVAIYMWYRIRNLEKEIRNSNEEYHRNLLDIQKARDEAIQKKNEAELKFLLQESKTRMMQ